MNSMLRMETLLRLMIMLLVINGFVPKWQILLRIRMPNWNLYGFNKRVPKWQINT